MRLPNRTHVTLAGIALAMLAPNGAIAHSDAHSDAHPAPHLTGKAPPAPRPAASARARSPAPRVASPTASQGLHSAVTTVPHGYPGYAAHTIALPTRASAAYTAPSGVQGWNNGWHTDARYDWAAWRATHRATFHPGYYYPPTGGYAYAPIGVGALLAAAFQTDDYWIDDPSIYHLPPAWDPYRWVRYYNDVLLVDIDTGEVVDVVPNVFW